jgi:Tol biopolymer transport system component
MRAGLVGAALLNAATLFIAGACGDATTALSLTDSSVAKPPPSAPPVPSFVPEIAFVSTRDGSPYIYLTTATGDSVVRFAKGENPAWIPNGRQIAFNGVAVEGKGQELHVMTVDGAWESVLPVRGSEPDWSPDGNSLLFSGTGGIYSAPTLLLFAESGGIDSATAGFGSTLLIPSGFMEPGDELHRPRWSPSGENIVFVRVNATKQSDIYLARADGSNPRRLVAGDDPRWSPDGLTISFDLPQGVVATVNVDGSNLRTRAEDGSSSQVNNGDWSPDGRSLVFSQIAAPSVARIFIFDIDRGAMSQLIPDALHAASANYVDFAAAWLRPTNSPWDY